MFLNRLFLCLIITAVTKYMQNKNLPNADNSKKLKQAEVDMSLSLRRLLKKSYVAVRNELKNKDASDWIRDNFYLIDKHYRALRRNRSALKGDALYAVLKKHCENRDYSITPDTVADCLLSTDENYSYYQLCSVKGVLSACAIIKLFEILDDGRGMHLVPNTVKLLIGLSDPRYDDVIPRLWRPEQALSAFENEYAHFSDDTKNQYRQLIAAYAKKHRLDETQALNRLIERAKAARCPLGTLLSRPSPVYASLWLLLGVALWSVLMLVGGRYVGLVILLLAVPIAVAVSSVSDKIISRLMRVRSAFRLRTDSIPKDAKTLVTVAALLTGGDGDEAVFESLVRFRYMNPDDNIYFCLLADLPDSETPKNERDGETVDWAKKKTDELNRLHGDRFCLFLRKRVLNKSENTYGGWERKRGAVCELIRHIRHGGSRYYYGGDFIRGIKYVLTLDSDTNLSVGSVKEMLSIALHPANRPVISKGRVVSGYGIIQPLMRTELASAYKTGFSRLISGSGGADIYSGACFHRRQALFGSGSFCGKGLVDVDAFDLLVNDALPEGLVLSHDVIEGGILRTLCATDITLTDSTPGNTVSFFRRQHRWQRGDFQNLLFLNSSLLDLPSRLRLLLTVFRHLSPVFSLSAIILGAFLTESSGLLLFLLAYSEFFVPSALSVVGLLFSGAPFACMRFFSKAYSLLVQTFQRLFFEISSSCRRALLTLNAFSRSAIRLVTRKKTLEWTTAAQTELLSSSLGKYVLDGAGSVLIGLALLSLAKAPFVRFAGLLYFVYPLVSVILAKRLDGGAEVRPKLTEKQKKTLCAHVADMFAFYYDNVNSETNHLPPDNVQFSPTYSKAMRTSPTNIGFYLVSLLAARDIDIISDDELFARLDASITAIEKLPKYEGNLYNWYDISNLSVIGDGYVSAVDSGNLLVMLVALKEGLKEYSLADGRFSLLVHRVEALIADADLKVFYDDRKNLFRIGLSAGKALDSGCYDMMMSEARMTAYYAVASSTVPKKHWQSLCRTLTHRYGYIGMLSWSGTAFEYLMPQLFLPLYRDSFLYESIAFAMNIQRDENEIWGVSESAYYSFDSDMNYQYKANGLQRLALRRIGPSERVVSPYSTYLSLCIFGNSALKNLELLEKQGMYGKYGLYEAFDLNNGSGIAVKSYMAHHLGMSIIACLNAVKGNVFVRRFMSDRRMASANELLQESIPTDAHIFEDNTELRYDKKRPLRSLGSESEKNDLDNPSVALLSRGDMAVTVSGSGHIGITCGDRHLSNTVFDRYSMRFSPIVVFSRNRKSYSCVPLCGGDGLYTFQRGDGFASHIASGREFSGRVRYSMAENSDCLVVSTRAEALKKYDLTLSFEPVLETKKRFLSHVSFSRLFIESEYDKSRRILYFHRRSGHDGKYVFTLAVAPKDRDMSFSFKTTCEDFTSASVTDGTDYALAETDNSAKACIDPICIARCVDADGGRAAFLITCGITKQECERNIRLARSSRNDHPSPSKGEPFDRMLSALLYGKNGYFVDELGKSTVGDLWSRGISGDHPLAVVTLAEPAVTRTEELLKSFLRLAKSFIKCELVFVVSDGDLYHRPVETSVRDCCQRMRATHYLGKNGGIFILRRSDLPEPLLQSLKNSASFYTDFGSERPTLFYSRRDIERDIVTAPQNALPLITPPDGIRSHNGYFTQDGFTVDKSRLPDAPYSYIMTGHRFSTVVTESSLGYTFFDNARERRLCAFFGDARSVGDGERILVSADGRSYDLCAVSNKVVYSMGTAVYHGEIDQNRYSVTVCVDPKFPVKLIRVRFYGDAVKARLSLMPVMGDSVLPVSGIELKKHALSSGEILLMRNSFGMTFPEGVGFAGAVGGRVSDTGSAVECTGGDMLFFLGACMTENGALEVSRRIDKSFFDKSLHRASEFAYSMLPPIRVSTGDSVNDALLNCFLPYQVSACRFYARGSFYQSGGAYGFRDQLQDCLSIIFSSPKTVRTHIIRCCAHQYIEGSVMHWWHTRHFDGVNRGIKSKCSDDLLYLPIVVADYIEKTGDDTLLETMVGYIVSPPLGDKNERYEQPSRSDVKENVYGHCLRALRYADRRGKNGLILMGSCDWNDAFSLVGEKGMGESVFSSMLYILACESFVPVCRRMGDNDSAQRLADAANQLRAAVETNAYLGDRYARAFCDDGTVLGVETSEECKIDILSHAFAVIAGMDKTRSKQALSLAFERLYDGKNRIFKLFSPAFSSGSARVGYIRGYVAGIRENGGQYSHGALWGALACIKAGLTREALLILDCVNPASRSEDRTLASKYKVEPYVISADIYSGQFAGRGGWSWYTGAASWYYRITLEYVLGIKLASDNTLLSVSPVIEYNAELFLGKSKLHLLASESVSEAMLNGKTVAFPLAIPDGDSILELPVAKADFTKTDS